MSEFTRNEKTGNFTATVDYEGFPIEVTVYWHAYEQREGDLSEPHLNWWSEVTEVTKTHPTSLFDAISDDGDIHDRIAQEYHKS